MRPVRRRATTLEVVHERLMDSLIHGDRTTWVIVAGLWLLTTVLVLAHRPGRSSGGAYAWALLAATTGTSLAGLPLSSALSVPRLRWRTVDVTDLLASSSSDTWRKLRGPSVALQGPDTDLAVPTVDASGRWMLVGMLDGKPIAGLPAAEPVAAGPDAVKLCSNEGSECRAWPVAWPDPARTPALSELIWKRPALGVAERALAYDVETGMYLMRIESAPGQEAPGLAGPHLEVVGRPSGEAKEGVAVLLSVRAVVDGRFRAARVAVTPDPAHRGGHLFHLQRACTSLTAARRAFVWVARPVLVVTVFALPLGMLVRLSLLVLRFARRDASREAKPARVGPWLETIAALAAGIAVAAPAVVAMASLWGSR